VRFAPDPVPEMFPDKIGASGTGRSRGVNIEGVEGPRGGGACFAGHGGIVPTSQNHYSILVSFVNGYLGEVRGRPDWSCKLLNAMEL
jgi:hypothetical protein